MPKFTPDPAPPIVAAVAKEVVDIVGELLAQAVREKRLVIRNTRDMDEIASIIIATIGATTTRTILLVADSTLEEGAAITAWARKVREHEPGVSSEKHTRSTA